MSEEMDRRPFRTEGDVEDIQSYASKLRALGDLLSEVFWTQKNHDLLTDVTMRTGEELGMIIQDYASAIEILSENLCERNELNNLNITECQEIYSILLNSRRQEELPLINAYCQRLRNYADNDFLPAIDLLKKFQKLREEILLDQKDVNESKTDKSRNKSRKIISQ